jgi:hypothetical protein
MAKKTIYRFTLVLIIAGLAGCILNSTPMMNTEEVCFATTGERDYHVDVILPPEEMLQPGQSVQVHFTGGYYMVLPSCKIVDGDPVYHYPTINELSRESRIVDVFIDEVVIHSTECSYDCEFSFSLPDALHSGEHHLNIRAKDWLYQPNDLQFDVAIVK